MLKKRQNEESEESVVHSSMPISSTKSINVKYIFFFIILCIAILGLAGTSFFYKKYTTLKTSPNVEVQKETTLRLAALGKLMELPTNETPTIATISDKNKLSGQPFFQTAENGDILFAYTGAMKAILYRPSINKIVNVATLSINQPADVTQGVTQQPSALRVAYYNGTATLGLSGATEKSVKEKYPNAQTILLTNAANKDYKKTLVIDLSKQHPQEARNLALLLHGDVGDIPLGEVMPDADLLIISGK